MIFESKICTNNLLFVRNAVTFITSIMHYETNLKLQQLIGADNTV